MHYQQGVMILYYNFLIFRFHNSDSLVKEVTRLVRLNPEAVRHVPDALQYLVTPHSLEADAPEVRFIIHNGSIQLGISLVIYY